MKKVARLRWIEEMFGTEYVNPYHVCKSLDEMRVAIEDFDLMKRTWGIRTDYPTGSTQGYQLPFVHHGSLEEATKLWTTHGDKFVYIVCGNILHRRLSGVAVKLDSEHVLFEWNDKEHEISQREMYKRPENLKQIALGPSGYVFPWGGQVPLRCVPPEYGVELRFDGIYDVMVHGQVNEATFTVRDDGKVIVW